MVNGEEEKSERTNVLDVEENVQLYVPSLRIYYCDPLLKHFI